MMRRAPDGSGKEGRRPRPFLTYLIAFHAAWAAWVWLGYPRVRSLGEETFVYALANIGVRLLLWVAPVWVYVRRVRGEEPARYLKLKGRWRRGVLVGLALSALNFCGSLARLGVPHFDARAVTWNSILSTSLLIGFVEEVPYRGFILQELQERLGFWPAGLLSSLLFVGIHLPGWFLLGSFRAEVAASVFVFGAGLAVVFRYSKSLWSVIVAHSLNDFLAFVVFRV